MKIRRKIVLGCAVALCLLWFTLNFSRIASDQDGPIRLVLGTLFSVLILLRSKSKTCSQQTQTEAQQTCCPSSVIRNPWVLAAAVIGTLSVLAGIIIPIHQCEWLGLLLLFYACLRWTLPARYSRDIFFSLLLFYWLHPLPGQIVTPLQVAMQRFSVQGSEWLLHCKNVRVWADGMILHTGVHTFGVPESCSGMRTGVTVLLCALGVGMLFRFRWYEIFALVVVGLFQVLVLNILRISLMVVMVADRPSEWGTIFLHDTMGIFLLAAILVLQLEASLWAAFRARGRIADRLRQKSSPGYPPVRLEDGIGILNPFRRVLWKWGLLLLFVVLTAGVVAFAVFKRRPYHRAMMIDGVVDRFVWRKCFEDADKTSAAALHLVPHDHDLRTKRVQVLLLRRKFENALAELELTPTAERRTFDTVLKARALMGLNRPDEAIALINTLPEDVKALPGVAIERAEFAAMRDDTEAVVENIVTAANWHLMIDRVRALFPYLAAREKWGTITQCRPTEPYEDLTNALIAVHAHLKMADLSGATKLLKDAMETWPDEPRFAQYLAALAQARSDLARARSEKLWNEPLADKLDSIVTAVNWHMMIDRVRALFPYLAVRQQWRTIARCHSPAPYKQLVNAIIAVHAHLKIDDLVGAWEVLRPAMEQWPDEPKFLEYLAVVAVARPGSTWEELFADQLKSNLEMLSADQLAVYIESGFRMARPDLAWLAYNRLKALDPHDPALYLAPAQFGDDAWFMFRKHYVGIPAMSQYDKVDLRSCYFARQNWPLPPLAGELTARGLEKKQISYLDTCVKELERRAKEGELSPRMRTTYATALKLSGRDDDAKEQLDAIQKTYALKKDISRALDMIHARLKTTDFAGAWNALKPAMKEWPSEVRFLECLAAMAAARPGSTWEELFADQLKSNLEMLSADQLAVYIESGFRMARPDLAWLAYNRLEILDPRDPALYLAPAQFGDVWFVFRNRHAGIPAMSEHEKVDLKVLYPESMGCTTAPLARELIARLPETRRNEYLQMCFKKLEEKENAGELSLRMRTTYATALKMAGRYAEAHTTLDAIERLYPAERRDLLFKHAEIYEQEEHWQKLYETLREYSLLTDQPRLSVSIMQINALMHLDLGQYALAVANRALKTFPGAPELYQATSAIWTLFDFPEEALFVLDNIEGYLDGYDASPVLADLYYGTERFAEADRIRQAFGMKRFPPASGKRQAVLLPRAELAISGHRQPPLGAREMEYEAREIAGNNEASVSPFVRELRELVADWYRQQGGGEASELSKWIAVGRDDMEQAIALSELMMLLARQERYVEANEVGARAVELLPDSPILWRVWIALAEGNREVVERAYQACPSDPEIWLAWLVVMTREESPAPGQQRSGWALAQIERAVAEKRFSVGTMVRAGDFMRRGGMLEAAATAARYATKHCRGLLPAYVLGLRSALAMRDMDWTVSCAMDAAEHALDPWPFYKAIAEIQTSALSADAGAAAVLEKLLLQFPEDTRWALKLGDVYLRRGDPERALSVLSPLVDKQPAHTELRTVLLAAEAARRAGELKKSASILETAYAMHPSNRIVLNNLVYTLALDQKTLPRAQRLLPDLLELWGETSFVVFDTAAVVSRQAGETGKAQEYLRKALLQIERIEPWWLKMNPHVVDIDVYLGNYDKPQEQRPADDNLVSLARELARKMKSSSGR